MISLEQKGGGEGELKRIRVQLVQMKYVLAGILGLAVIGKTGTLVGDLGVILNVFMLLYLIEYAVTSVLRLPATLANGKAARSDARMSALLAETRGLEDAAASKQK